jgi:pilus assembly protein FimV
MAKRKKHKPNSLHLAVLAGIASINANAVGMGEIAVRSRLNEPLRADVPLNDVEPKFADRAMVRFHAPPVDAAGSTNSSVVSKLTGKLVRGKDGGMVLEIRSRGTIREPVVTFHVELILPNAHTRREFTVLLDPPAEATATSASAPPAQANPYDFATMERNIDSLAAAPGSKRNKKARAPALPTTSATSTSPTASTSSNPAPKARSKPATERTATPAKSIPVSTPAPAFAGDVYGPVVRNETLWSIARKVRPNRDVGMFDAMQLIFAENPHAFVKNDMNRLRVGVTLKIPSFSGDPAPLVADAAPAAVAPDTDVVTPPTVADASASDTAATSTATTTADVTLPPADSATTANPTAAPGASTPESEPAATVDTSAAPAATTEASPATVSAASTDVTPATDAAAPAATTPQPTDGSGNVVQQAAAMQAQLNALATRLETMQSTLVERETKIANLEQTLTDLNARLKEAQTRNGITAAAEPAASVTDAPATAAAADPAPSAESTVAATDPAPANVQAATPVENPTDTAFYEGIRLPDNTWVWGMSAAVVAGLGAAFLARRRRVGAKPSTAPASAPATVAASARTEADARRAEKIISDIAPPAEDYQRTVKLERPIVTGAPSEPESAALAFNTGTLDAFNATAIDIAPTEPALGETNTLAWEDNNTVPNWSLERTIERTLEEAGETLAQTRTEPFLPDLQSTAPAASSKVVPLKLDAARVEPVLKEVDLQMAYLQFEDAERLLMQPLQENPNEPSLLVKLAEVHVAAGNIDRFVDLAVRLSKIPEVRDGADWKKIARMGEMVAPNHPLFEFVDTVELTSDGFNVASNG